MSRNILLRPFRNVLVRLGIYYNAFFLAMTLWVVGAPATYYYVALEHTRGDTRRPLIGEPGGPETGPVRDALPLLTPEELEALTAEEMRELVADAGHALEARGRSVAVLFSLLTAIGMILPVTWVYGWTRPGKKYNRSFAHTLLVIPVAIALVVFLVKGSLALAFSLAGIVAAVRFRTSLSQPMDAVYMLTAIGIGLASGTQLFNIAYIGSVTFVTVVLAVWRMSFGARPAVLAGWTMLPAEPSEAGPGRGAEDAAPGKSPVAGLIGLAVLFLILVLWAVMEGYAAPAHSAPAGRPAAGSATPRDGSLDGYELDADEATRWTLPRRLTEISGLALTPDERLLAHNDEEAVVFDLDLRDGSVAGRFQLADLDRPVAGDFEGIAAAGGRIWLVTSAGRLYESGEGADGASVLFRVHATGAGRDCEIEGLAHDEDRRELLLLCKNARSAALEGKLAIFRWSLDDERLRADARTVIPVGDFSRRLRGNRFQPSGIERHPVSGNYFVVAARQAAVAEVTPDGEVLAVRGFTAPWHRQIEGITFAPDGALLVADEGRGGRARLTRYPAPGRGGSSNRAPKNGE